MFDPLADRNLDGSPALGTLMRRRGWLVVLLQLAATVGCNDSGSNYAPVRQTAALAPPQAFRPMPAATPIEQALDYSYADQHSTTSNWSPFEPRVRPEPTPFGLEPRKAPARSWPETADKPPPVASDEASEPDTFEDADAPAAPPTVARYAHLHSSPRRTAPDAWPTPAAQPTARRGAATAAVNQAEGHYRRAFELANRGALFAARAELLAGLRALADGFDADNGTTAHADGLAAAMRALDEADDFAPRSGPWPTEDDIARAVRSHRTPLLRGMSAEISASAAQQMYLAYAAERLAAVVEFEPVGAQLLHGLGKTYGMLTVQSSRLNRGASGKAMAFHHAAVMAAPRHYLAANDLAVLLAQGGRWSDAARWFSYSLSIQSSAAAWHNLSIVQANLGQTQAAQQAQQAALAATGGSRAANDPALAPWMAVRWLPPNGFAQTSQMATDPRAAPSPTPTPVAGPTKDAGRNARPELREARRSTWMN